MDKINFVNGTAPALNATNLNQLQTNVETEFSAKQTQIDSIKLITDTINTQQGKLKIGNILIQWGVLSNVNVPASSYTGYEVTFSEAYTSSPEVFVQSKGNYNIISQVAGNELTKTTINVRSNDGTARTGRNFAWLAIGLKE